MPGKQWQVEAGQQIHSTYQETCSEYSSQQQSQNRSSRLTQMTACRAGGVPAACRTVFMAGPPAHPVVGGTGMAPATHMHDNLTCVDDEYLGYVPHAASAVLQAATPCACTMHCITHTG